MSPQRHINRLSCPIVVTYGTNETPEFQRQSRDFAGAVKAAAGISVPFDLTPCAQALDRGLARWVYTANFMRTMRRKVAEKARTFPGFVDVDAACRARTFSAYDEIVTAPLSGFADARDYWRRASSGRPEAR